MLSVLGMLQGQMGPEIYDEMLKQQGKQGQMPIDPQVLGAHGHRAGVLPNVMLDLDSMTRDHLVAYTMQYA